MPLKIERKTKERKLVPYNQLDAGDVFRIVESDDPDMEHLKGDLFLTTSEGAVRLEDFMWFADDEIMTEEYGAPEVEILSAKLIVED